MLKVDTTVKEGEALVEMQGTQIDITADLATVIQSIFETFCDKNSKIAGLVFMRDLSHCMTKMIEGKYGKIEEDSKKDSNLEFMAKMSLLMAMMSADKRHAEKKEEEKKDIRSADFMSDEEFRKWFRGGDDE